MQELVAKIELERKEHMQTIANTSYRQLKEMVSAQQSRMCVATPELGAKTAHKGGISSRMQVQT